VSYSAGLRGDDPPHPPHERYVGQLLQLTTGEVANGGWCVARPPAAPGEDAGPVIFVRHALPGERVRARITEVATRFARADAVEILDPAPDRVEPPCPQARPGGCGGCDWQHARPAAQRALKASVIAQQLRRLAGIEREVTVEPIPAGEPAGPGLGWRTRVQFTVRADGVAGLRAHRSHEVIDVGECLIAHPTITELGITRRRWPGAESVEALAGPAERAVIVNGGGAAGDPGAWPAESVLIRRRSGGLTPLRGRGYLTQHAAGRDWRVSAGAFWQVHPGAADAFAEVVLAALEPRPGDTALDLYCGAGLFGGVLAEAVGPDGMVIGVESNAAAVRDARHNLRGRGRIHRGDVATVLRRGALPAARLVVADPPRAGLAREVIDYLARPGAERFAYVSCDPATLARDIGLLLARGWELTDLRAFDAFPMTHHVECVATLTRLQPPAVAGGTGSARWTRLAEPGQESAAPSSFFFSKGSVPRVPVT
jgi:tRNA/tmRNA/rRNA uracil-C5-methylase (TrmA/RlmC/RlmD family)